MPRPVLTAGFKSVNVCVLPLPVVGVHRMQVSSIFLAITLFYWYDASLLRPKLAHCFTCKHFKYDDSAIVTLLVFSSDAVHTLSLLLQNMQATSAAKGSSGRASKKFIWLLITMPHIRNQYISRAGTFFVK